MFNGATYTWFETPCMTVTRRMRFALMFRRRERIDNRVQAAGFYKPYIPSGYNKKPTL